RSSRWPGLARRLRRVGPAHQFLAYDWWAVPTLQSGRGRDVNRIVSCFTNCYGASGVWTAVERIRDAGINHLELALRGHNLGGLVIPESAVLTEKTDDATAASFCEHLAKHGVKASGCNVGRPDIR